MSDTLSGALQSLLYGVVRVSDVVGAVSIRIFSKHAKQSDTNFSTLVLILLIVISVFSSNFICSATVPTATQHTPTNTGLHSLRLGSPDLTALSSHANHSSGHSAAFRCAYLQMTFRVMCSHGFSDKGAGCLPVHRPDVRIHASVLASSGFGSSPLLAGKTTADLSSRLSDQMADPDAAG
jgi:hypothetical protein